MVAAKPIVWMRAVRDADPPFATARFTVLLCLGLRMGLNGTGFASAAQLAMDAKVDERTAKRATSDARDRGFLKMTRRGHRLGNGAVVASEWALLVPADSVSEPQGDTGVPLSGVSRGQDSNLNVTEEASQGDTRVTPRGPLQEELHHQRPSGDVGYLAERLGIDDDDAIWILNKIKIDHGPTIRKSIGAYIRGIPDSDLRDLLKERDAAVNPAPEQDRAAVLRDFLAWAATQPECPHRRPGGDLDRPDTGLPHCAQCRLAQQQPKEPAA